MTYQEMIETRPARLEAAEKHKAEWLANADLDQMEIDHQELDSFQSLSEEF